MSERDKIEEAFNPMIEFNIEARWPDLFEPLANEQRFAVVNTLASAWHEGWVPNREHVENLTQYASGVITREEYDRRADERARARYGLD